MRYFLSATLILFVSAWVNLQAQVIVVASQYESCGPAKINFSFVPSFTVTKVKWDFGIYGTSTVNSPAINYPTPGIYSVKLTLNDTFTIVKPDFIKIYTKPNASFTQRDSLVVDSFIYIFNAAKQPVDTFIYTYAWNLSDSATDSTPDFVHNFAREGTYSVTLKVTDNHGCVDSTTATIFASSQISVPNVFTPNGDSKNDQLRIQTNGKNAYRLRIYTRSGSMIFETTGAIISWEGQNASGVFMNSGVYYYTLECIDPGNSFRPQAGFIYLLK